MKNIYPVLIFVVIALFSCNKNKENNLPIGKNIILNDNISKFSNYYLNHFKNTKIDIVLSSMNNNSFITNNSDMYCTYNLQYNNKNYNLYELSNIAVAIDEKIIKYEYDNASNALNSITYIDYPGMDNRYSFIKNYFYKDGIVINYLDNRKEKRTQVSNFGETIKSIEPIYFTYPKISEFNNTEDIQKIRKTVNRNFNIKWNEDESNENGIVIILEWRGEVLNQNKIYGNLSSNPIRIIKCTDDDGIETLNNDFFQPFPEGAIVDLILIRGSIVIGNNNNEEYKIEIMNYTNEKIYVY